MTSFEAHVDGAAFGNPGPGGIGVVLKDAGGKKSTFSMSIGVTTNNQAEYAALITALEEALAKGATAISVFSDSELMVRQVNGRYRVRNEGLKPLYIRVCSLKQRFTAFTIDYIPREFNGEADRLAKRGCRASGQH